jgi:hypothetical protein
VAKLVGRRGDNINVPNMIIGMAIIASEVNNGAIISPSCHLVSPILISDANLTIPTTVFEAIRILPLGPTVLVSSDILIFVYSPSARDTDTKKLASFRGTFDPDLRTLSKSDFSFGEMR